MRHLRLLLPYLGRHKASLIFGVLVILTLSGVTLTQPYLLRLTVDELEKGHFQPLFAGLIILGGFFQFGLGFLQRLLINRVGHLTEAALRRDFFKKCQELDRSFFDENSVGDLIVRSTSDITIQRNFINQLFANGFTAFFLVTLSLTLMFAQNWKLALIGIGLLPFLALAVNLARRRMQQPYQESQQQLGEISNRIQEVLASIRVIKAYTCEEKEAERYTTETQTYVQKTLQFARWSNLILPLVGLFIAAITGLLLWVGGHEITNGNLTIGQFIQFNAYLLLLTTPFVNIAGLINTGQQAATSMERLLHIFLLKPRITEPEQASQKAQGETSPKTSPQSLATTVEFKGVGLRFNDRWALRDIDFRIEAGKTVAVVGPTGSGKSLLAGLVGRVYDPQEGAVLLNDTNVQDWSLQKLRQQIGHVPQQSLLFSLSLYENIAFAKPEEATLEEVWQASRAARLSRDLPQIPGGLEAKVGEKGVTLSGGQKQRAAIARALLPQTPLVIMDDALSSVDARTQNQIAANLRTLTEQGKTLLIVTQRLALVKDADWIVVLDGGRIVDQGRHAELLERQGLYAQMYRHELATTGDTLLEDELDLASATFEPELAEAEETMPELKAEMQSDSEENTKNKKVKNSKKAKEERDEIAGSVYNRRSIYRLLGYLVRYRKILALVIPTVLITAGLELVGPLLSKIAIDEYITPGKLQGLELILALFGGAALGNFIFRYLRSNLMNRLGQYVIRDLRVELFQHLLKNSLKFFDRNSAGSLIGRLTSDMDAINDLLSNNLISIMADLLTLAAIVGTMFLLDWRLTLISLCVLPVLFVVSMVMQRILRRYWRIARRKYSVLVGYLAENYSGMLIVQLFNRQSTNFERFNTINDDYSRSNRLIIYINGGLMIPGIAFLASLANALLLFGGGTLFIQNSNQAGSTGVVTFGLLVAFLQYTERAFQPIRDLAERSMIFQAASASAERIFGLLDYQPEVTDPVQPQPLVEDNRQNWAEVRFDKVDFGYEAENPVLRDMSFKIRAGEKVAIVGPTGAGKTSLVSLLGRHYDVQSGRITIGGVDIRDVAQHDLRRHLALVLQDPVLLKGTVADNVRLGRSELSEEQIREACRYVGADSFIQELPGGYDYELQEGGTNLSAGQRQLISFARAIAYSPDAILILDEATSSVDTATETIIQKALEKLLKNRTALIIAHRLSTIRNVDRILVVERGRLVEQGNHQELLAKRGLYFQLCRNQLGVFDSQVQNSGYSG